MAVRRIIHVDMDAFFASVEQRDRPELRGRPIVVGGAPTSRGVVAAASYEARRFGVRSAMPSSRAARLCPDLIFVRPDFARYQAVSRQLRAIFDDFTDVVEPLSLDEAFLDVTESRGGLSGTEVAAAIRQRVREELGLTCSAGVGPCKLVAKIASDHRKPDGLTVVPPSRVRAFLDPLPVGKLWGVGPATAGALQELGLRWVGQLARAKPADLVERFGNRAEWLVRMAQGDDPRPVAPRQGRKSRGAEQTFAEDISDVEQLREVLADQSRRICADLARAEAHARTVTVKVRYDDFTTVTRAGSLARPTADPVEVERVAISLLARTEAGVRPVRLVGVSLSNLAVEPGDDAQLELPWEDDQPTRSTRI